MFTHYEDMKGNEKCKKLRWSGGGVRGHPRASETSPFDRVHMTSYSTLITSGSAMAEGPRNALVSRNSATTKHPI